MKVGFNTLPLYSGHKMRGIGYYTKNMLEYLKEMKDMEIVEFNSISEVEDVEIIHYPWFDLYFHSLPIRKKFPTVVTVHDVIPLLFPKHYPSGIKGKINFHLQKLALKNCVSVITDSLASKSDIMKYLGVKEEKIAIVPLAADSKFRRLTENILLKVKMKYKLPEKFIMYAGDANWVKNLSFLLESFRKLIEDPEFCDVKLVLAGGIFLKNVENIDHPELDSLKKFNRNIIEFNLKEKIYRPGNLKDEELAAFYNLATVYVQPSLYEGFGLPILQSFACGTPVISSNRGSLPEVGGKAALYFDPANTKSLVSLLKEVLSDKSLRYKLAKQGFKEVSKFTWEETAVKTVEIYRKVLKGC